MKVLIALASLFSFIHADDELIVRTTLGKVRGTRLYGLNSTIIHGYLGIPYAAPPTGDLRFKDPQPHRSWEGILEADMMPDYCVQYNVGRNLTGMNPIVGKENCLFLNVYKPAVTTFRKRLPIIVFIHGGAFMYGGAKDYNPLNFMPYDVIFIVIQYRLGVLGFLSADERPLTGNYGLKDQQFALKWIHANIENFNGNSDKITLMGESAGAASVNYQMLSDGSRGLFHRVIMMSGNALSPWAQSTHHYQFAKQLGVHFKCLLKSETESGTQNYVNCMRKVKAKEIAYYHGSTLVFLTLPNYMVPRVDGIFLKNFPEILMKYQLYNYVNVLTGITADEGSRILAKGDLNEIRRKEGVHIEEMLMIEKEKRRSELVGDLLLKYNNNFEYYITMEDMMIQMYGDRYINFAHHVAAAVFMENPHIRTYLYELEYSTKLSTNDSFHKIPKRFSSAMENLRLLFNGGGAFPRSLKNEEDIAIKDLVLSFFMNFVKTGSVSKKDDKKALIWTPSKPQEFNQLKIRIMHQRKTYPLLYCEMETLNIDAFISSWLYLPLEQSFLLRSDSFDKLVSFFDEKSPKCYTPDAVVSDNECVDYINEIKMQDWIDDEVRYEEVEDRVKTGEWKSYPWAKKKGKSVPMIHDYKVDFPFRDEL